MSAYDLIAARKAGIAAFANGQPLTDNPWPYEMSDVDEFQVRKHEAWRDGWEGEKALVQWKIDNGIPPHRR